MATDFIQYLFFSTLAAA